MCLGLSSGSAPIRTGPAPRSRASPTAWAMRPVATPRRRNAPTGFEPRRCPGVDLERAMRDIREDLVGSLEHFVDLDGGLRANRGSVVGVVHLAALEVAHEPGAPRDDDLVSQLEVTEERCDGAFEQVPVVSHVRARTAPEATSRGRAR